MSILVRLDNMISKYTNYHAGVVMQDAKTEILHLTLQIRKLKIENEKLKLSQSIDPRYRLGTRLR